MKRVAIIAGKLHSGGKKNLIMEYYRHIDRTQVQFDFICDEDSNAIPDEEIKALGGKVYRTATYQHLFSHSCQVYRILKENHYEIMHCYDNTLNLFPLFIGWLAGVRVRISESISKGDKGERKTVIKKMLRPFSHWFTNCMMANSVDCGKWQFGKSAYEEGKISIFKTVINAEANGFDKTLRENTRKQYGWENKVVYGFIARYVEQKNPLFLMDVFSEIHRRQPNAVFVTIGFGDLEKQMERKAEEWGLGESFINLGRREDIKQFYNAFDAFLLPSLYEGMPVVGIEAQCAGLPIFFSTNITEETTASPMAHYIPLADGAARWAEQVISVTTENIPARRSYAKEVTANGFDSANEALRMQKLYLDLLKGGE